MNFKMKMACAASMLAMGLSANAGNGKIDVIVTLKDNVKVNGHKENKGQAKKLANGMGLQAKHTFGSALFGFSATIPEGRLQSLKNNPNVANVEIDEMKQLMRGRPGGGGGGGSTSQTTPWGISAVGADTNSNDGSGVHVYVLDTGIDSDHPDLAAHLGNGYAATNCKGKSCNTSWDDDHGHGTHVAGSVGAIDNSIDVVGVAPGVTLHAIKICTSRGSCPTSNTIAGLDWMVNEVQARGQVAVANLSIGGAGAVNGTCSANGYSGSDSEFAAYCNAANAGVVIAVAAGNSSANAANYTPAGYSDAVVTVSSAREGNDWNGFSNYGTANASWTSNNSAPVAIAAPGGSILSLRHGGGTTTMSGTSMASPHVAGAMALYLASNPQSMDYSAFVNTRAALLNSATSTSNWNNTSGNPHSEDMLNASGL